MRDERREGLQFHFHRQIGIGEANPCQWILAGEFCFRETAQAGRVVGAETILPFIRRQYTSLEDAGDGPGVAGLHPDRREGVRGRVSLVGAVEDFPVTKLAAATEGDASGGYSAEREGEHLEVIAGEDAGELDLVRGDLRGWFILGPRRLSGCGHERLLHGSPDYGGCLFEEVAPSQLEFIRHR